MSASPISLNPLHGLATQPTAPVFRSLPMHPETMAVSVREIDAMRDEIASLRAQLKDQQDGSRVEIGNMADLLKASGTHVANLSSAVVSYQAEVVELRDERDEYRDRFDHACEERDEALTRVGELTVERDAARGERDEARAVGSWERSR